MQEYTDPGCVVVEASASAVASVIWLHGLGADGHDFEPIVPDLSLPADLPVRFVFPHAPVRPVTLNGGIPMRAWFDIERLDFDGEWDIVGVNASVNRLAHLVESEMTRGIAPSRVVVAGFSQGGAVVLEYLLQGGVAAGVIALSTFHPVGVLGAGQAPRDAPPIFAAHGQYDPVVPYTLGADTLESLERAGYTVAWHRYPMAHQICAEEIAAIGAWLCERLRA